MSHTRHTVTNSLNHQQEDQTNVPIPDAEAPTHASKHTDTHTHTYTGKGWKQRTHQSVVSSLCPFLREDGLQLFRGHDMDSSAACPSFYLWTHLSLIWMPCDWETRAVMMLLASG